MSKGNTRGKNRDREDFTELLQNLKENNADTLIVKAIKTQKNDVVVPKTGRDFLRMRSDEKVLFFYDKLKNIVHDKHCEIAKKIPLDEVKGLPSYPRNKKQCLECALRAYLRVGAEDYKKHKQYEKLFEKMKADIYFIRKIYIDMKCKTRLSNTDTIRIQYGNEAWKIKSLGSSGKVSLSHNDYKLHYDGTREKYYTYHIQNDRCQRTSIQNAINVILRYKSHRPLSVYTKREQQVIKLLKKKPEMTQKQIAETLGVSVSTIGRTIQSLKETKSIKRIGGNRYGSWKITT